MVDQSLFHSGHIARFRARAQDKFSDHNFLIAWSVREIGERIALIKRDFSAVLMVRDVFGALLPVVANAQKHTLLGFEQSLTPEALVGEEGRYDLIVSAFDMHMINDLPGVLVQLRRALKPDGVFIAAFPGGATLHELRESLLLAEMDVMGGASPRVFPFLDKAQAGQLMQRAGFSLPVVDSDVLDVSYRDIFHVMGDVRGMGEANALSGRHKFFTPSKMFFEAARYYAAKFPDDDGRVQASFEIIFVIGWAPHDSQQKPLPRGSGQVSLGDVL